MKQIVISIVFIIGGFALGRNSHTEKLTVYTVNDIYYLSDLRIESESGYSEKFTSNTERNNMLEEITARDGGSMSFMDNVEWATRQQYLTVNQYFDGAIELQWDGPNFGIDGTNNVKIIIEDWQVECSGDIKRYYRND